MATERAVLETAGSLLRDGARDAEDSAHARPGPGARLGGAALVAILAALRVAYLLHHRVNSDEPQHLHVAWAWTQGLLPYRDVFDNHSPLFGMLFSPVVASIGERADVVLWARLAMLPLTAITLAATWFLARRLFSPRAAWWAVLLALALPDFALGSVEFRTDQLWTAAWLSAMAVLLGGRWSRARAFTAGLFAGAAFAASMKTSLLVLSLALGGGWTWLLLRRGAAPKLRGAVPRVFLATLGMLVLPAALAAFFVARGAGRAMVYGTVGHNLVPGLGLWEKAPARFWLPLAALAAVLALAPRVLRAAPDPGTGARRVLLLSTAAAYYAALAGWWPLVTRQDVLPFVPMAAVLLAAALLEAPRGAARAGWPEPVVRSLRAAPALAIVCAILWTVALERPWRDRTRTERDFLAAVLQLTRPGESVMDLRGETIYRPRPYYYALEEITRARLRQSTIRDEIAQDMVRARTPVAILDSEELPPGARAFLDANYLPVGPLRVAGQRLEPPPAGGVRAFRVAVPLPYAIIGPGGPARGWLDGIPCREARSLEPGLHVYRPAPREGVVALVWAPALARGFSPFPSPPPRP